MPGLSAILSAAKPSERTDQYVILAAMFALNAHTTPVTAKQIKDLLELHLGAKTPRNVSARLREYGSYVEPAEKGPPLLWLLTPAGVEALRATSALDLGTRPSEADFKTDVGIVCALEQPEFEALMNAMGGPEKWKVVGSPRFPHVYRETVIATGHSKNLRIVGTTSTSMGLTAAAIVTTHLILQFKPRLVVMVGIAAGTRAGDRRFGDVLVADPSVDYNSGKVSFAGGIREFLPDPYPIGLNPRLRSVLHKYRGDHPVFVDIRGRWRGSLPPGSNRVHIGPLGAADQVIDDESRIVEIQRNWRKLIGVEMETYGVYRACYEAPDPKPRFVSFKAVCDFAAVKSDSWQQYAAFVAAEFTSEFLKNEWEALWPNISN
jgi:nucleoside phosphorylase